MRWLAGGDLPMGPLIVVIETLAALAYAAALKLASLAGAPSSHFMTFLVTPLFMSCPVWTFLLRRIAVYETAVFFAQHLVLLLCSPGRLAHGIRRRIQGTAP
jgi:hypothetical protein